MRMGANAHPNKFLMFLVIRRCGRVCARRCHAQSGNRFLENIIISQVAHYRCTEKVCAYTEISDNENIMNSLFTDQAAASCVIVKNDL